MRPTGRGRAAALTVSAALLVGAVLGASPATADPGVDAATQARALSVKVDSLRTQAEVATEKYNTVNTRLTGVVTQMITASERLDTLSRINSDSRANATRRISAIYKAGGGLSLYASVLDGSSPDDMMVRLRTVQSLVGDDYEENLALQDQVDEAAQTKAQMRELARQRTDLERQEEASRNEVDGLLQEAQKALDDANAEVRRLAKEEEARRQAAAESAAKQAIGTVTLNTDQAPGNPYAQAAMDFAASKIGLPYVWGGNGPNGYDCSGLMQQAYRAAGLSIMRVAADQYRAGPEVALSAIAPGDLVFWATNPARKSSIHHVAMYVGGGKMIEAPHTGAFVRLVPLRLSSEFAGAVRPGLPAGAR